MRKNVIIKTISRLSVPFIQVFALYVIVHGALGAGGGFQGGVVFAASFILMIIAFGLTCVRERFGYRWIVMLSALGITIYATIGLLCLIPGGSYLGYGSIETALGVPHLHGYLIDAVEVGIGITVMATMTSIIYDMSDRGGESS